MSRANYENIVWQDYDPAAAVRRLLHVLKAQGVTQAELSRRLCIRPAYLSDVTHGRQQLSPAFAVRVARALALSPGWLLFGEEPADEAVGDAEAYRPGVMRLPVVGRASATGEANVIWEPIDPPDWAELPAGVRCVEVQGDSMRPLVWPGQRVIMAPFAAEPADRDLVVAELADGRQVFKRWWSVPGSRAVTLESLRTDEPERPIVVSRRQIRRVWRIVGVLF